MNIADKKNRASFSRRLGRSLQWSAPLLAIGLFAAPLASASIPSHDFSLTGWATAGAGVTGGAGGQTVTVSTPEGLVDAIAQDEPLIVQVQGTIDLGQSFSGSNSNGRYYVASNKSIVGLGEDAGIRGGEFRLAEVTNVIIRNLSFREAPDTALAITHGTTHVWIDHNDFANAVDGLLDITRAADFITVSWNRFANHDKVSLVGASDGATGDRGHLRVTYHHNWFFETNQRHPRVRYGKVHVYNNLYSKVNVGVGVGVEAEIISENNHFDATSQPFHFYDTLSQPGFAVAFGDIIDGSELTGLVEDGVTWSPNDQYAYSLDSAHDVPELVMSGAGVGVIDPTPEAAPSPAGTTDTGDSAIGSDSGSDSTTDDAIEAEVAPGSVKEKKPSSGKRAGKKT